MHVLNHFTYIYVCVESKVGCFTASKHDTMMSSGLFLTLSFPNSALTTHCSTTITVWGWACTAIHSLCKCSITLFTCNMGVESRVGTFIASKHDIMTLFELPLALSFPKFCPHMHSYQCKQGELICPTLHIHPIWMLDAIRGGLQLQQCHHNIIWAPRFGDLAEILDWCPVLNGIRYNTMIEAL